MLDCAEVGSTSRHPHVGTCFTQKGQLIVHSLTCLVHLYSFMYSSESGGLESHTILLQNLWNAR